MNSLRKRLYESIRVFILNLKQIKIGWSSHVHTWINYYIPQVITIECILTRYSDVPGLGGEARRAGRRRRGERGPGGRNGGDSINARVQSLLNKFHSVSERIYPSLAMLPGLLDVNILFVRYNGAYEALVGTRGDVVPLRVGVEEFAFPPVTQALVLALLVNFGGDTVRHLVVH